MIIHRFWHEEGMGNDWHAKVLKRLHPRVTLATWTPSTIHRGWMPDIMQVCEQDAIRHMSNVIRYQALLRYGGIWVDFDLVPLQPLGGPCATAALGKQREGALLRFPASHPMLRELVAYINRQPISDLRSCDVSGAHILTKIGKKYPDVGFEPRVFPFDAHGHSINIDSPIGVHTWMTSSTR